MRPSCVAAVAVLIMMGGGSSFAQSTKAPFFQGKTITIFAGSTPGGGVDLYARLVGLHLGDHIAGHPTILVQDQPGAGSLVAAHNLYTVAPKDGTQIAVTLPGALFDPLMNGRDLKPYDPRKLNYIGNANADATICVTRRDAPVKTYAQVFSKELVVAATGPGSVSVEYPVFEHNLLGAKIKVISGYPGSSQMKLAVYHNEVQGVCGLQWSTAKQQYPEATRPGGILQVLVEEDIARTPPLAKLGVPLVTDFAKTEEQKKVSELFFQQGAVSRPFILPPGVSPERVQELRKAFDDTMKDPAFLADAEKEHLDINSKTGEDVQNVIRSIYNAPARLIAEMRKASVTND